jgi:hypothetical protein
MARNSKSSAKAERADHRLPPDERLDRDAAMGLLPPEELDRPPDSRLTAGDLKRAAARAKGVMGASKKLDPSLKIPHTRNTAASSSAATDGAKKSRGATAARKGLDKGSVKVPGPDADKVSRRVTRSNAEITERDTSTARRSPAPRPAHDPEAAAGARAKPREMSKRTGITRQRAPAPGNVVTVPKREAITGQKEAKRSGVRSTSSTGGAKPPKRSARAGAARGGSRARGADGNTIE